MPVRGFKIHALVTSLALASQFISSPAAAAEISSPACERSKARFMDAHQTYLRGQFLLSAASFSSLRFEACSEEIRSQSWLGYAFALNQLDEPTEATAVIEQVLMSESLLAPEKARLAVLGTWISGQSRAALTESQKSRWHLWLARDDEQNFDALLATSKIPTSATLELEHDYLSAPRKSKWLAGFASGVLPGAGQVYAGNYQTAALAFVINALFLGATIEFARKDLPFAAVASGGVFSITYFGNIVSAVQGVDAWNRRSASEAEDKLKANLLPELNF